MRRNWIKLYVDQSLRGTMMDELSNEERWSWIGLLLLAGDSPVEGQVCITNDMGYTDKQICKLIDVPLKIFIKAKEKMIIVNKIKILENNVIQIVNWKRYQSEYKRQRKYRNSYNEKLQEEVTNKGDNKERRKKKEEKRKEKEDIKEKGLEFEEFWKFYRSIGNLKHDPGDKGEAKKAYKALRKKEEKKTIIKATNGYADFLKYKKDEESFDQKKYYASTFLRSERWKRFLEFEYKPSL